MKLLFLVISCLFASVVCSWGMFTDEAVEHRGDAICFDLDGDGRDENTETGCHIYVQNAGRTVVQHGVQDNAWNDCIPMHSPSAYEYTYLWTSCSDAMWIDEMQVLVGDCWNGYGNGGRRNLGLASTFFSLMRLGVKIYLSNRVDTDKFGCQNYGADNSQGWCLSTDRNDYRGGWYHRTPAKQCFRMLRLGKPAYEDGRVWSLSQHYQNVIMGRAGRRHLEALIQDKVASVQECEKQNKDCTDLASEVFELMRPHDESEEWDEITDWHTESEEDPREIKVAHAETFLKKFDKDEDHKLNLEEFEDLFVELLEDTQEEAQKLFGELDQDASGQLDLHELCEVLYDAFQQSENANSTEEGN